MIEAKSWRSTMLALSIAIGFIAASGIRSGIAAQDANSAFVACRSAGNPSECYHRFVSARCGANDVDCKVKLGDALGHDINVCLGQQSVPPPSSSIDYRWTISEDHLEALYWPHDSSTNDFARLDVEFTIVNGHIPWDTLAIELKVTGDHGIADGVKLAVERGPRLMIDATKSDYSRRPTGLQSILSAKEIKVPLQNDPTRYATFVGGKDLWEAFLKRQDRYEACGFRPIHD